MDALLPVDDNGPDAPPLCCGHLPVHAELDARDPSAKVVHDCHEVLVVSNSVEGDPSRNFVDLEMGGEVGKCVFSPAQIEKNPAELSCTNSWILPANPTW